MTFRFTGTMILLILFIVGLTLIVVWKKAYSSNEHPISQHTQDLMHDLTVSCMQGNDSKSELCSKVLKMYEAYCPHNNWCFNLWNGNAKDITKGIFD